MTILELATEVGIEIPTLCYDPHLSPLGACRVCLVEDESSGRLLASCVTPISPGMVVSTRSQRVIENRRVVVELMLASHPDTCIVCDKGNRCKLRKIATDLGVGLSSLEKIPTYHAVVDLNPFIRRDLSKCIRCGRCIRADREIAVVGAIDYTDRGFESRPATLLDVPLEQTECNFCGICVSVCPTGALSERNRVSTNTASQATRTVCPLCGMGCAIVLEHRDPLVLGSRPAEDRNSVNHVSLCVKGHYGLDFVNSEQRLTSPLIRRDGELVPTGWDEALDFVAVRLTELKEKGGGRTLGALGASRSTNEENYLLQKFVRGALGSNNIDSGARLRGTALFAGIEEVLGCGAMTHAISHIRAAQEILVVGADPLAASPIVGQMIKQAVKLEAAHLTLVDPLPRSLNGGFAGTWIRPSPGTQASILAGFLREMLSDGLAESARKSLGRDSLNRIRAALEDYTPERVEDLTGVPARLVKDTAKRLSAGRRLAVIPGAGVAREQGACFTGALLAMMTLIAGDIGQPGCGLFPIALSLNDQGALDMGACPDRLPGYHDVADSEARAKYEEAWSVALPAEPGMDYISMIEAALTGTLKGLYIVGENPVRDCPETDKVEKALAGLDLLVVQDLFLTETASVAQVVLPSTSFAEKDGTFTNLERRVQRLRQTIAPLGESRSDGAILVELMGRMGIETSKKTPADVLSQINEQVPSYRGITLKRLELEREGIFWPCRDEDDAGTPVLHADRPVHVPDDITLEPVDGGVSTPGDEFPLWLLTTGTLFHSADGVRSSRSRMLVRAVEQGGITMNPFDAGPLGIEDGDTAVVRSSKGSLKTRITVSEQTPRGILVATSVGEHTPEGLSSMDARDPEHGAPQTHRFAVRVEGEHGNE
jgi:formate dehydrogenase alpha subunit